MREQGKCTCCYCGREVSLQGQAPHQERCLGGPMGDKVREFMRRRAVDGVGMSSVTYRDDYERKALGLVTQEYISLAVGSWQTFVESCGLRYLGKRHPRRRGAPIKRISEQEIFDRIDAFIRSNRELGEEIDRSLHSLKGCRVYAEPFRDMDTGRVYQRYVMELR